MPPEAKFLSRIRRQADISTSQPAREPRGRVSLLKKPDGKYRKWPTVLAGGVAAPLMAAACSVGIHIDSGSSSDAPTSVTASPILNAPVESTPTRIASTPGEESGGICSPNDLDLSTGENDVVVDDSPRATVTFLIDNNYSDRSFPGPSLEMLLSVKGDWRKYKFTRVASI